MRFRALMFDLDGTLLDSLADLGQSMNTVLAAMGYPGHPLDAYRYFVGDGLKAMVRRALPRECDATSVMDSALAALQSEYAIRWSENTRPYEGIDTLLDHCGQKKLKLAVLSNKPHPFTRKMVSALLPRWHFEIVWGARPLYPPKPDPTGALAVAAALREHPADILFLGDSRMDMQAAGSAGLYAAGVLWGFRPAEELLAAGARILVRQPIDLLPWIFR